MPRCIGIGVQRLVVVVGQARSRFWEDFLHYSPKRCTPPAAGAAMKREVVNDVGLTKVSRWCWRSAVDVPLNTNGTLSATEVPALISVKPVRGACQPLIRAIDVTTCAFVLIVVHSVQLSFCVFDIKNER